MKSSLRRFFLPLALGLLLSGCMTAAQQAERDEARCSAKGPRDSEAFQKCVVELESQRDARREANRREMLERPSTPYIPAGSNR